MDIATPDRARQRKRRRLIWAAAGLAGLVAVTWGLTRLKPAAPALERATVWIDTVKRGEMLRQVRGVGTLVPEDIRWIPSTTEGRVERLVLQPGTVVTADSIILELSNPELELTVKDAQAQARVGRAQLAELRARLVSQRLDQQAALTRATSADGQARLKADAYEELAGQGLVAEIDRKIMRQGADDATEQLRVERERLVSASEAASAQLAAKELEVQQQEALARLRQSQRDALRVRAGMPGVLQLVAVEVGQRVGLGVNLARVAQPTRLKAVVRIPETLAKDVVLGLKASVDTRNGVVAAHVVRIDPAVQNGSVAVDLALDGPLPAGARPDLSVDGTVELERLTDVLFVGRPAAAQGEGSLSLFRLEANGRDATRTQVRLGRASVSTIEVVEGLKEGDQVVLSDTSTWDAFDRIRLE